MREIVNGIFYVMRGRLPMALAVDAAMYHRKAVAANMQFDPPRQPTHPRPIVRRKLRRRMRKPCCRQAIADAAVLKAAAAIGCSGREVLLAIAHENVTIKLSNQRRRSSGVGAIGDDVAGADNARRRNTKLRRRVEESARGFQIAVRPAKDHHRAFGTNEGI
jgi:hypothetical protein